MSLSLTELLCLLDEPILSLLLGASVQRQEIVEGSTVYFDCNIQVSHVKHTEAVPQILSPPCINN